MGDIEAPHGLYFQFKSLGWRWADFSLFFLPAPPIHHFQFQNIFHANSTYTFAIYQMDENLSGTFYLRFEILYRPIRIDSHIGLVSPLCLQQV